MLHARHGQQLLIRDVQYRLTGISLVAKFTDEQYTTII